ncbi:hypothetical protein HMPREF9075_01133 [Capnocytophaga sp. oral taxon 332 str. F0381]|nr:hypothetical protein HMPREF9075_01133 [Capnocytophaga sp. oral taxon 332 str. F0381]
MNFIDKIQNKFQILFSEVLYMQYGSYKVKLIPLREKNSLIKESSPKK